jgi:sugar phosphate isomerase/epimerase
MNLRVFQALWAMQKLPRGETEWTVPEKVAQIIEGGFDGIEIAWSPSHPTEEAVQAANEAGLRFGVTVFPTGVEGQMEGLMERFLSMESPPAYVNIQPNRKVFTVAEGAPYLREWAAIATDAGFRTVIETHRDRMTTDLRFTLQLMDAVPELRMNGDLSHFVVGQEFAWPVSDEDHALIRRVLERADMFHGRVASREQVQIPITWEHHRPWVDLFLGWWEEGFRLWRARSGQDDELVFVCELGPPWYSLTGADGQELSDRWEEARILKGHVREIWSRLEQGSSF